MKLLLDTHALIWSLVYPERLSPPARDAIQAEENIILVSSVSAYEIEYKRSRDPLLAALPWDLNEAVDQVQFTWLSVQPGHMIAAGRLPLYHRDPWDRVLAAQALIENLPFVTVDPRIAAYGVRPFW